MNKHSEAIRGAADALAIYGLLDVPKTLYQAADAFDATVSKLGAVEAECADRAADVAFYKSSAEKSGLAAAVAEDALSRHGYRKSCDIPACNCGDQWNHGGHAAERLRELGEVLYENGKTPLTVANERAETAESRLGSCETALHRIIEAWDGDSESMHDDPAEIAREALGLAVEDQRPCTCHPDDNPPVPCARKYALEECRAAAVQEHGPSDQPLLKRIYNDLLMRAEVVNGTPVVALGSSVWRDLCHALEGGMVTGSGPEAEAVVRQLAKDAAAVEKLKPPECPYCFPKDGKHAASCELASASEEPLTERILLPADDPEGHEHVWDPMPLPITERDHRTDWCECGAARIRAADLDRQGTTER